VVNPTFTTRGGDALSGVKARVCKYNENRKFQNTPRGKLDFLASEIYGYSFEVCTAPWQKKWNPLIGV
jgi:hypothetical protein